MAMGKVYQRINWENIPSEKTPIDEINLNKMDKAIDDLDDRVVSLDSKIDGQSGQYGSNVVLAHIVSGANYLSRGWLSATNGGAALTPNKTSIYVVMTDGLYSRLMYMFNGTSYFPIGEKTNVRAAVPDIVRTTSGSGGSNAKIELMRFRPAETTQKIRVYFEWTRHYAYGGGGHFGIENGVSRVTWFDYGVGTPSPYQVDITLSEGPKTADFVFEIQNGSFSECNVSKCIVTEISESVTYTNIFQQKNRLIDHMPGLVPAPTDAVGDTGVLMSDGKWHTIAELKTILGIG